MTPKHRAFRAPRTRAYRHSFRPRHCAGETCLHDHAGDRRPPMHLVRSNAEYAEERATRAAEHRQPWERPA